MDPRYFKIYYTGRRSFKFMSERNGNTYSLPSYLIHFLKRSTEKILFSNPITFTQRENVESNYDYALKILKLRTYLWQIFTRLQRSSHKFERISAFKKCIILMIQFIQQLKRLIN